MVLQNFSPSDDFAGDRRPRSPGSHYGSAEGEDLPYKVELWDEARAGVETVLAVTANATIGYAAFYAATKEFPTRYIVFRDKNGILSRWNAQEH
jgi:hypothetical protein